MHVFAHLAARAFMNPKPTNTSEVSIPIRLPLRSWIGVFGTLCVFSGSAVLYDQHLQDKFNSSLESISTALRANQEVAQKALDKTERLEARFELLAKEYTSSLVKISRDLGEIKGRLNTLRSAPSDPRIN